MDPLSILASAITLATVVGQGLKQIKAFRDAPADLSRLLDAVSELHLVLVAMHRALGERKALAVPGADADEADAGLVDMLGRAAKHLQQLRDIIGHVVLGNPPSGARRYLRVTWLRNKSKAEAIGKELHSIKLSLAAMFTASNSVQICRIQHLLARQDLIQGCSDQDDDPVQAPGQSMTAESGGQGNREVALSRARWCSCVCHKPIQLYSPASSSRVAGALAVDGDLTRAPCNEKMCNRRQSSALRVTYRSPSWLMARVFTMTVTFVLGNPQLSLQTMRVLPRRAEIFRLVCINDLQGMKRMFADGTASVYDVDDQQWSLVHVRQISPPSIVPGSPSAESIPAWAYGYVLLLD